MFGFTRKKPDKQAAAHDGFANLTLRLGLSGGSQNSAGTYNLSEIITRNRLLLESAYRQNWFARFAVDCVAQDMTRSGIKLVSQADPQSIEQLQQQIKKLHINTRLLELIKWGRLYGGALAVAMVSGQDLAQPLRPETIGKAQFLGLRVFDRWFVTPAVDRINEWGEPEYYDVHQLGRVHWSRAIRYTGVDLPHYQKQMEMYWGASELEAMYDRMLAFDTATHQAAQLVNQANLRTVRIDGLREAFSMGGKAEDNVIKMFDYVRLMQSNMSITLLDKLDDLETTNYTFAGLDDVIMQLAQQLSGATRIPLVKMFGQSPRGFGSGETELRQYYDTVHAEQSNKLQYGWSLILDCLRRSLGIKDEVDFEFVPLWQSTPSEKAANAKTLTDTIIAAHAEGLVDAPSAMRELRQETGIFSNVTDEAILEAESMEEPPEPEEPAEIETEDNAE